MLRVCKRCQLVLRDLMQSLPVACREIEPPSFLAVPAAEKPFSPCRQLFFFDAKMGPDAIKAGEFDLSGMLAVDWVKRIPVNEPDQSLRREEGGLGESASRRPRRRPTPPHRRSKAPRTRQAQFM